MDTTLAIGPAEAGDEADAVALWRSCGLVVAYNDPGADFRFARAGACSDVLLGRDGGGRVVGSVMVGHDGHRGWLYYVAADPGVRGTGIGRRMVRAAEAWLAARGVAKVQLMVRPTNTQAAAFYERLGFEETPRTIMARWLAPTPADEPPA
ncbi:MAG: GNAT family acetyltransferase [Janthinobacterium lividum]